MNIDNIQYTFMASYSFMVLSPNQHSNNSLKVDIPWNRTLYGHTRYKCTIYNIPISTFDEIKVCGAM